MSFFRHPVASLSQGLVNISSYGEQSSFVIKGTCALTSRLISTTAFPVFLILETCLKRIPKMVLAIGTEKFPKKASKAYKFLSSIIPSLLLGAFVPQKLPCRFLKQKICPAPSDFVNLDSGPQSKSDLNESRPCTPCKASEEDQCSAAAASSNSRNLTERGIEPIFSEPKPVPVIATQAKGDPNLININTPSPPLIQKPLIEETALEEPTATSDFMPLWAAKTVSIWNTHKIHILGASILALTGLTAVLIKQFLPGKPDPLDICPVHFNAPDPAFYPKFPEEKSFTEFLLMITATPTAPDLSLNTCPVRFNASDPAFYPKFPEEKLFTELPRMISDIPTAPNLFLNTTSPVRFNASDSNFFEEKFCLEAEKSINTSISLRHPETNISYVLESDGPSCNTSHQSSSPTPIPGGEFLGQAIYHETIGSVRNQDIVEAHPSERLLNLCKKTANVLIDSGSSIASTGLTATAAAFSHISINPVTLAIKSCLWTYLFRLHQDTDIPHQQLPILRSFLALGAFNIVRTGLFAASQSSATLASVCIKAFAAAGLTYISTRSNSQNRIESTI